MARKKTKEVKEIHLNRNYETPIFEKYSLSIEQAADYFGIGQKKLRQIVADHEGADFILYNGNRVQIKRKNSSHFWIKHQQFKGLRKEPLHDILTVCYGRGSFSCISCKKNRSARIALRRSGSLSLTRSAAGGVYRKRYTIQKEVSTYESEET